MTTRDAAPERLEARRKIDEQIAKDRANRERRDKRRGIRPNMGPGFLSQDGARAYGTCLRVLDAARRRGARSLRITVHNSVIEFEHDVPADPPVEVNAAKPANSIDDTHAGTERLAVEIKSLDGEDMASTIDAALIAGRYTPLSIRLNGTPIERWDFLRGADRIETVESPKIGVVRIGVWLPLSTSGPGNVISHAARISAAGVPWVMNAPSVKTFDGLLRFRAETEAMGTELTPVLGEPDQAKLIRESMKTIGYRLLAEGSVHEKDGSTTRGAPKATRSEAARWGITIPEPIVRLRKWDGRPERTRAGVAPPYAARPTTGPDTVVVDLRKRPVNDPEGTPTIAQTTLERTMVEAFAGQVDARCADPKLSGTDAYDRLPVIRGARIVCRDQPSRDNPDPKPMDASTWASTRSGPGGPHRPYRLALELEIEENGSLDPEDAEGLRCRSLPLPFALLPPVPGGEPGRDCLLVSAEPWPDRHDPEYITEALLDGFYRFEGRQDEPAAERDARRRKMLDAAVAATSTSDRDRRTTMIKRLAVPEIINYAPRGATTTVTIVLGPDGTVESETVDFDERRES